MKAIDIDNGDFEPASVESVEELESQLVDLENRFFNLSQLVCNSLTILSDNLPHIPKYAVKTLIEEYKKLSE
jgi:archaellum component FlaC